MFFSFSIMSCTFVKITPKYFIFLAFVNGIFFRACVIKYHSVLLKREEGSRLISVILRLGGRVDSGATM